MPDSHKHEFKKVEGSERNHPDIPDVSYITQCSCGRQQIVQHRHVFKQVGEIIFFKHDGYSYPVRCECGEEKIVGSSA